MREKADSGLDSLVALVVVPLAGDSAGLSAVLSWPVELVVCVVDRFQRGLMSTAVARTPG